MKIAYDAKRLFQNFTGLGNYSRTLIETLAHFYPEHEYHLFAPKTSNVPRVQKSLQAPSVWTHFPQGFWRYLPSLWRAYGIGQDLAQSDISIFHGLSHELPLSIPAKMRTVVTIHDLIHERYPTFYPLIDRRIYSFKFKRACQIADTVVAISEQTKQDIIDFYKIDASKIQVIYQSCDPIFYKNPEPKRLSDGITSQDLARLKHAHLKKKYGLPDQFMLYVGTVNERKNLRTLIKSLQIIGNQLDIKLVVVGNGGSYFAKMKQAVQDLGLENRVVFLPKIEFTDLPSLYKMARLFILPSFFEGFGIPIVEALWSGTPVITSTGSCFAEAGGANSIYVNPHDAEAIADAILKVWQDEALRQQMILRGYQYVEKFRDAMIGEAWINLYRKLLTNRQDDEI
jgi:glycosyltransferase involved in cell wall biosynthesis